MFSIAEDSTADFAERKRLLSRSFQRSLATALSLALLCGCAREPLRSERPLSELFPTSGKSEAAPVNEGWTAALSPRQFTFPADHFAHEDYRVEWWYYTGNLVADDGRRFGYQLTFFRTGLHKEPENPSKWAVRDLYTTHFAVSDFGEAKHHCFQRNSRRGIGQAGASTDRYEVWNGDWKVWLAGESHRLQAADFDVSIDLTLSPTKPPVLHGERGLSQKGSTPGNASHYYSLTRLATEGSVCIAGQTFKVRGGSWMDHEFSTSFLEPNQIGWDWFSIQLDDGVDLMLYRMRRADGSTDPFSSGTLVSREGDLRHLTVTDYDMTSVGSWKSRQTGAKYPLNWKIQIPSLGYDFAIRPAFAAQEMTTDDTTGISYWEGAIDIAGDNAEGKISGRGYMELTGYVGPGLGSLFQ